MLIIKNAPKWALKYFCPFKCNIFLTSFIHVQTEQILLQFCTADSSYHVPEMCFNHNGACARSTNREDSYHLAGYQNTQIFWSTSQALISHEPVMHVTYVEVLRAVTPRSLVEVHWHASKMLATTGPYSVTSTGWHCSSYITPIKVLHLYIFIIFNSVLTQKTGIIKNWCKGYKCLTKYQARTKLCYWSIPPCPKSIGP